MKKVLSKSQAEKKIQNFFEDIKNKTPKDVKKIKRLSMKYKIPLKDKRKLFCKKCFTPYSETEEIRIKKGLKIIKCKNCGYFNRWKVK